MIKLAIVFMILGYVASGCSHLEVRKHPTADVGIKVNTLNRLR